MWFYYWSNVLFSFYPHQYLIDLNVPNDIFYAILQCVTAKFREPAWHLLQHSHVACLLRLHAPMQSLKIVIFSCCWRSFARSFHSTSNPSMLSLVYECQPLLIIWLPNIYPNVQSGTNMSAKSNLVHELGNSSIDLSPWSPRLKLLSNIQNFTFLTPSRSVILRLYWNSTCRVTAVSSCASSPCQNGGTCVVNGNSYTCSCTSNWTGSTCNTSTYICDKNNDFIVCFTTV